MPGHHPGHLIIRDAAPGGACTLAPVTDTGGSIEKEYGS